MSENKSNGVQIFQEILKTESQLEGGKNSALESFWSIGAKFAASQMFGITTAEQGFVVVMECASKGLSPIDLMRRYHVIKGKLSERSDYMLKEIRMQGGVIKWLQYSDDVAELNVKFEDNDITMAFTWEQAQAAGYCFKNGLNGILKDNWRSSRGDMLRNRVASKVGRMLGIVFGLPSDDEATDVQNNNSSPKEEKKVLLEKKEVLKPKTEKTKKKVNQKVQEAEIIEPSENEKLKDSESTPEIADSEKKSENKDLKNITFEDAYEMHKTEIDHFAFKNKWKEENEKIRFENLPTIVQKNFLNRPDVFIESAIETYKADEAKAL